MPTPLHCEYRELIAQSATAEPESAHAMMERIGHKGTLVSLSIMLDEIHAAGRIHRDWDGERWLYSRSTH